LQTYCNIILNGKKLKAFPLKPGMTRCPLSPFLLNIVLEFLTKKNKKREINKQIGRKEVK
jgi:hypothetical protein